MSDKPTAAHVLGVEVAGAEIRGAKLSSRRGVPILDKLFLFDRIDGTVDEARINGNVKPLYTKEGKEGPSLTGENYLIAAALPVGDVLVRSLEIGLKKESDIDSVLAFQAEPLLPYPVESAILDRIIISRNNDASKLTLLATRKERLQSFLDDWQEKGLVPEVVSCCPFALARFGALVFPSDGPLYIVHVSRSYAMCVLIKDGKLLSSQSCSKHLGVLEQAFLQDQLAESNEGVAFLDFKWDAIAESHNPHLSEVFESFKLELTRVLFALGKQNKGEDVGQVLFTGDIGECYDLIFHLGHTLGKQVLTPDIPETFNAPLPQVLKFAVPIGVALASLLNSKDSINFRQGEFAYPDPWKRLKKPLAFYFLTCLAVSCALYFLGEAYVGGLEDDTRRDYVQLLTIMQKPHSEFEETFKDKSSEVGSMSLALKDLSMQQLEARIVALERDLKATPDIFPLLPNILTVSDVLAWLNRQPTVSAIDPKTGALIALIQVDNFVYTMVKRPEISKKNEKYQVRVELEFTTESPKEAREFHDALIAPNAVVDPKGEVKWSTNRGKYRASFFLKDKTIYPAN